MPHALFHAALDAGDRTAILDAAGPHSYRRLLSAALIVRTALLGDRDDLREERIAFLVPPGFDYVATQWGIWAAGGIAVPLGLTHPLPELEYVVTDARVTALVTTADLHERVAPLRSTCGVTLRTLDELLPNPPTPSFIPEIDGSRRAMILYTSGSTGRPKGVVTTHANVQAQIDALIRAWEWTAADHILHVLPLHHVHGIVNVLGCALRAGAVCEFLHPFDPVRVWERFARGDLTLFMAVPTIYAKLIATFEDVPAETQQRWSEGARRMRLHVSGSAALPVPVLEKWEAITGQRLLERYGMTEIGMALSNPLHGARRPGFVGTPLPGVEVRRVGEAGEVVEKATPGEIEVRGPGVFLEYWGRPGETAASFHDGWFRTGDIAVVEEGSFRILGRASVDIIKTGGYKVSALEIEDALRAHPAIRDCAVVGVPDEEWGERVALCAVLRAGAALDLDYLRQWAKERLAPYKVPSLLRTAPDLPRNAMGKVQKPAVRDLFTAKDGTLS
jgi:malonyl-CoA/methylmalonyl-CoA synthetase